VFTSLFLNSHGLLVGTTTVQTADETSACFALLIFFFLLFFLMNLVQQDLIRQLNLQDFRRLRLPNLLQPRRILTLLILLLFNSRFDRSRRRHFHVYLLHIGFLVFFVRLTHGLFDATLLSVDNRHLLINQLVQVNLVDLLNLDHVLFEALVLIQNHVHFVLLHALRFRNESILFYLQFGAVALIFRG